ncbi:MULTISPECIES: autotransporter outer membrane beta-barrel domain-containing protein [Pasteurellaceae]|uniref:Autotransporter outer membrane beta-barrel domain-containing protein n=1 Tax=Pasteurella atlantica TaxID=2827233 RepID=A0AAW8CTQ0_9PAST|nr:autotransporter outer membrane beta-barrel domain-containing protein [Pasteurella atlantica]MDP8040070.1 autotransporter outer membrane beta-barrel domain-containing protein [Pasteurella atlantica]MDP8044410.1 autotransporter outer membrane beta-barrel domain-containing protein [Pasteurella atlantica]MDP8046342.1 autotransporter outer membrane beta-barrel domain-containing protein [Pasteurella atlantica]MDP8062256.1 autotransporter outer membrane beta-barrel domain-containing protein [Pasteu
MVVAKIDVENTKLSMARLGNDAIGVTSLQSQILQRLQQSRYLKQGEVGYGVRQDMAKQKGDTTASVGLGLSYGVGYGITTGVNFDKSLSRQLPKRYKTDGNTGLGIFANWKGDNWFVETTAAWQKDKVKVERPLLANTEAGSNKNTMKGSAVSLTTGYDFGNVSVYSSLRHRQVSRDAYVEKNAEFAASFAKLSYKDTALALGVDTTFPLTEQLNLLASAEIEQQLNNNAPTYAVSMPAVGSFSKTAKIRKTRGRVQAGLSYDFSPKFMLSFTPYYESTAFGYNGWGTSLQLKGVF